MRSPRFDLRAIASLGVFVALGLGAVGAQAVTISPVLVELSPARRIASISISNPDDAALTYQVQTLAWTQIDGVDRFADSDVLLVAPAIATIPAGGTQIFRVAFRVPPGAGEQAYRLIFEDITQSVPQAGQEVAISLRVNHDLPVFFSAAGGRALPVMTACAHASPAGFGCLRIDNRGDRYVQLRGLTHGDGSNRHNVALSQRVLAGAWKELEFVLPAGATSPAHPEVASSAGTIAITSSNRP